MKWLQLNELPVKFLFVSIKSKTKFYRVNEEV